MKRNNISLVALVSALAVPAQAQEIELDEIVVSANLIATSAKSTGSPVILVKRDEIEDSGAPSLASYFQRIAGMSIRSTGPVGTQTGLQVRGVSQNYVGVTVDGIDVTDPSSTQTAFDFGHLLSADVGRVEVLKGSQSARYGSNAMGGAISIETLRPTEKGLHQSAILEVGSYKTRTLSYGATFMDDHTQAGINLSKYRTDGFSTSDQGTEADGFDSSRVSFSVTHQFDSGLRIGLNGFGDISESEYDPAYYLDPLLLGSMINANTVDFKGNDDIFIAAGDGGSPDEALTRKSFGLRAVAEFTTGAVDHKVSVSNFRITRSYHEQEVAPDYSDNPIPLIGTMVQITDATYLGTRRKTEWTASFGGIGGQFILGADWSDERLEQFGDYGTSDETQDRLGFFGEYTSELASGTDVALSLRRDSSEGFGSHLSWRVAMAHELASDTIVRFQAGTGFRAPSTFEQFSIYNPGALKVEESRSFDFGIEQRFGETSFARVSAFMVDAENLIGYDFGATNCPAVEIYGPGCYGQVEGLSKRSGVEVEAGFEILKDMQLRGSYTYTDSGTNASDAWTRVARHSVSMDVAVAVTSKTQANIGVVAALDRPDFPDGSTAKNYATVNASLTHEFGNGAAGYLRLENVFDEDYQLTEGYNTSGRAAFVGLRAKF
jgi:vitamin B12 transporter